MFPNNITFSSGSLYIKDELIGPATPELVEIPEDDYALEKIIGSPLTELVEMELEATIDVPTFTMLTGPGTPARGFTMQWEGTYQEQIRKHKKKRINKKWAKRYGYRDVPCLYKMENAKLLNDGLGSFEFRADCFTRLTRED